MNYYIFDVDGTLIDTEKMYMLPLYNLLKEKGYSISYEKVAATFGITALDAVKMLGVEDPQAIKDEWYTQVPKYTSTVTVFDGIKDMLNKIGRTNQIAIATSKVEDEFQRDVVQFGLDKYFDAIVLSSEVAHGKPAPDMILKGIEKLAADPQKTVYVGDAIFDMQAAHAAGVKFGLAGWNVKMNAKFADADFDFKTPNDLLESSL